MAYDQYLAERIRNVFHEKGIPFEEKKMMGGVCYLVNDKMCAGITDNKLMARIDPEIHEDALVKKGCRDMDFTRRTMKGFVYVDPEGIDMESDLNYWIQLALDYNPKAKSSKGKKKN
ncbi:MAG: TfoX/Sxy family protein [Bacteroidales bacterium]|nr:TfoX/Sxy family protein [Bacteroidales bacterium]